MRFIMASLLLALATAPLLMAQQQTPPSLDNSTPTTSKDQPPAKPKVATPPSITHKVNAAYTDEAREAGINGICLIQLIVDANGRPQDLHVLRSLGYGLDENAVKAVQKYKFSPAHTADGRPVATKIVVEVNFKIYFSNR